MRVHLIVSGRVQGVFFRHNTKKFADSIGLKGFVRNLSDGKVEIAAEGEEEELKQLVEFCRENPGYSEVDGVKIEYSDAKGEFEGFDVK